MYSEYFLVTYLFMVAGLPYAVAAVYSGPNIEAATDTARVLAPSAVSITVEPYRT